jgi:hypothetical protein
MRFDSVWSLLLYGSVLLSAATATLVTVWLAARILLGQ